MKLSNTKLNVVASAAQQFLGSGAGLNLDFANSSVLDPRVSFSRGTNATYVDSTGNIAYAPHNLLTYSEQFDNAAWTKFVSTVQANTTVAPNGTATADKLTPDVTNSGHFAVQDFTAANGVVYTVSAYAKAAGYSWLRMSFGSAAFAISGRAASFNISTGVVGVTQVGVTASIQAVGDGWYRCSISATALASALTNVGVTINNADSGEALPFAGDGVSGLYIWGAQLNLGTLQPYNSTTTKNLLGYSQSFENAAWTKSNSFIQTNLLTYSEQFDNAAWTKSNSLIQTNQLRNNTMQGAVAGTPGTAPTNTSIVTGGGISSQIVSVGAEDGVNYYDVRFFGIGSSVAAERVYLEFGATVAASTGQTWSLSAYLKLVSGVVPAGLFMGVDETGPGTTYIKTDQTNLSVTSALLRYNYSWALSGGANVAFILPQIGFNSAIGVAVDFTLRIGLPQLVQGAVAGDVVRTYGTVMPVMYPSPIGALTADKLIVAAGVVTTGGDSFGGITQNPVGTTSIPYAYSFYARSAEVIAVRVRETVTTGARVLISLLDGSVVYETGTSAAFSVVTSNIGNGWWRISLYRTPATTLGYVIKPGIDTGDGTSGIYIWGAQLVQGATPGDYQATTTAALPVQYRAPDGSLTADKLVENTATIFHTATQAVAVILKSSPISFSIYAKQAERSTIRMRCNGYTGNGFAADFNLATGAVNPVPNAGTGILSLSTITPVGNGWYRCMIVGTTAASGAGADFDVFIQTGSYTGDGTSGVYIWGAQLSDSASLDPYSYNFTTAPTAAAYYGPRFDYDPTTLKCKGLLIEEQRTNSVRNNTMQGAVAGTPGTLPTNWFTASSGGISVNVIGTGTESGITYIDVQFAGTPSVSSQGLVSFDAAAAMVAAPATPYSGSFYVRRSAGSNTNVFGVSNTLVARDSGTVNIGTQSIDISSTINAANIRTNRVVNTYTTPALTAFLQHDVRVNFTAGLAFDITLRIGLPQLELGAFATTVIPTTTVAVTRAADVAVIQGANFSNWYNQSEGTLFGQTTSAALTISGVSRRIANINNGTENNRITIGWAGATGVAAAFVTDATVTQATFASPLGAYSSPTSVALAYKANDFQAAVNGVSFAADTVGTIPSVDRMSLGDVIVGSTGPQTLNGHIARIAYWPRRLSDTKLTKLTK